MICGKYPYLTEHDAQVALVGAVVRRNLGAPRYERRHYHCRHCDAWHLTSKTFDPYGTTQPTQESA